MEKLRKRLNAWNDGKGGPRKGDWMAALAIVAILTLFFCFLKDFKLTVTQSLTFDSCLFNGRLKDFYTIVNKQALSGYYDAVWGKNLSAGANYSIINYATLGVLCLPIYVIEKLAHITIPFVVYELELKLLFAAAVLYKGSCRYLYSGFNERRDEKVGNVLLPYFTDFMVWIFDDFSDGYLCRIIYGFRTACLVTKEKDMGIGVFCHSGILQTACFDWFDSIIFTS